MEGKKYKTDYPYPRNNEDKMWYMQYEVCKAVFELRMENYVEAYNEKDFETAWYWRDKAKEFAERRTFPKIKNRKVN